MNLLNNQDLRWKRFTGTDHLNNPIDYSAALLKANSDGHVDLLYKWAPNSYCHFLRHTAITTSTILEGELHVIDVDPHSGRELATKVRTVGDYASKEPGDVHMERGGPKGALVLFHLYTSDGLLVQGLAGDGSIISESTLDQILRGKSSR